MNAIDGIDELHMSGRRAVFTLKGRAGTVEAAIADALEEREMALESFERVRRPRAKELYLADAGIT